MQLEGPTGGTKRLERFGREYQFGVLRAALVGVMESKGTIVREDRETDDETGLVSFTFFAGNLDQGVSATLTGYPNNENDQGPYELLATQDIIDAVKQEYRDLTEPRAEI